MMCVTCSGCESMPLLLLIAHSCAALQLQLMHMHKQSALEWPHPTQLHPLAYVAKRTRAVLLCVQAAAAAAPLGWLQP
jgi:hypothetical protein